MSTEEALRHLREGPIDIWPGSEREPRLFILWAGEDAKLKDGLIQVQGTFEIKHFLHGAGVAVARIYRDTDPRQIRAAAERGRRQIIVNAISEPDQYPDLLKIVTEICKGWPTVNDPTVVMKHRREVVSAELQGIEGLVVPPVTRIAPGDRFKLRKPTILRRVGTSTGKSMTLAAEQREADEFLTANGDTDCYATEYHECRSPDGYYRKTRVRMVAGQAIPNHLFVNEHWKVHGKASRELMLRHPKMVAEEAEYLQRPIPQKHVRIFSEINRRIGVDHYGIDYCELPDGRLILFEANAGMRSFYPEWRQQFPATVEATSRMIVAFQRNLLRKIGKA